MGKDKIVKIVNLDDDVKSEFAAWLDRVPKEAGQDKTWSERYEDLFRKSNGNNNYLVGQNKDRNWLMRRKDRQEVIGMIKAVEESTSNSRANRRQEARAGAEEVARSGRWSVYRIKTPEASVHYGAHTRWCIAGNGIDQNSSTREDQHHARSYWTSQTRGYSKVFYYIRNDDNKFALLWDSPTKFQLWDALDNKIIQSSEYDGVSFERGALNEIKMFCYTVPKNPQTNNFDFKEMFVNLISQGNARLRNELTSYNRRAEDGEFVDFTDEDFNDPTFNQLVCDTIPTTSNIDLTLSRMRRTNAPLIRMKITCNTTNAIRDSLKTNNKIDLYNSGFKLKSENKSFRAVKDRFKKLAEMNADPNSGLKITSIGYLVSFAPALKFIPYTGNDNAQFIIEDQNQINTLLNNFSRYEDHALYDLFSVGINDVLTNSLKYINRYMTSHEEMSTDDYNKMLGKLNEYLQYYIRVSVKANRSQLGFTLPSANIAVIDEEALNKIIQSYELSTEQSDALHTVLSDATNTARIRRNVQRDITNIENDTNATQVEATQMGGLNTAELEQQLSIDDLTDEPDNTAPEEDLLANEEVSINQSINPGTNEESEEDDSDTWPNGVPKVILGKNISGSEASTLGPLTPEQREGVVLFDIINERDPKEMNQEEYDKILAGVIALGNDREYLNDKMNEYGITLVEETEETTEEENTENLSVQDIKQDILTYLNNDVHHIEYNEIENENGTYDFDVEFNDVTLDITIRIMPDGTVKVIRPINNANELEECGSFRPTNESDSVRDNLNEILIPLHDAADNEMFEEDEEDNTNPNLPEETYDQLCDETRTRLEAFEEDYNFRIVPIDDDYSTEYIIRFNDGFRKEFYITITPEGTVALGEDDGEQINTIIDYRYNELTDNTIREFVARMVQMNTDLHEQTENALPQAIREEKEIVTRVVGEMSSRYDYQWEMSINSTYITYILSSAHSEENEQLKLLLSIDNGQIHVLTAYHTDEFSGGHSDIDPDENLERNLKISIASFFEGGINESELPPLQQNQTDAPKEKYKFLIYGIGMNNAYIILNITPNEVFTVNNLTDNVQACNEEAIRKATELYNQLKENDFESLNLRDVHYMKVVNEAGSLIKIIR